MLSQVPSIHVHTYAQLMLDIIYLVSAKSGNDKWLVMKDRESFYNSTNKAVISYSNFMLSYCILFFSSSAFYSFEKHIGFKYIVKENYEALF